LVLARHGESTWNDERRIQGQEDPPLSRRGEEQARKLAQRLACGRWAGFYVSDLERARATAAEIAAQIGQEPVPLRELREVHLGSWQGLSREQLVERFPAEWEAWVRKPSWDIVPNGEGAGPFETRVADVLGQVVSRHPDGDVLVVTHGGVIQVALLQAIGRPSDGNFPFLIHNASLTTLERGRGALTISGVNDTCHLA
jgi:broad specificity phosphatase PhoE